MVFRTLKGEQKAIEAAMTDLFLDVSENAKYDASYSYKFRRLADFFFVSVTHENFWNYTKTVADIFLNTEKYLKSAEVFWGVAAQVWTHAGGADNRWLDAWNRYDRRNLHINKRVQLFGSMRDLDGGKYAGAFLQNRNSKIALKVYRIFTARAGKRIRSGEVKADTGYFVQEEGAGFSYSLSKNLAASFGSAHLNMELFNRYSDKSAAEIHNIRKSKLDGLENIRSGEHAYFLGIYELQKQDIVGMFLQYRNELEVVAEKSKLLRYEVMTVEKAIAANCFSMLERRIENSSVQGRIMLHGKEDINLHNRLVKGARSFLKQHSFDAFIGNNVGSLDVVLEYAGLSGLKTESHANGHIKLIY